MRHLRLFENHSTKKYGFTYTSRDWKSQQSEVMKYVKDTRKKYPDFFHEDMDTDWNDEIYTAVTNYENPQGLVDQIGEDVFLAINHAGDDEGIMWFDTVEELEKIVADGMKAYNEEWDNEDKEYEKFKELGAKGEAAKDKYMKEFGNPDEFHSKVKDTLGLPERKGGWSMMGAAQWLAMKELGAVSEAVNEEDIKVGDPVWVSAHGDRKEGTVISLNGDKIKVKVKYNDVLRKKETEMTMGFPKEMVSLRENKVNEEDKIKNIKLSGEDANKFKKDFTVDNKYMFDNKLSDEDRKAILMAKIDAIAKKKRLNPNQTEKLKKQYSDEISKMGNLDQAEQHFKDRWSQIKYKKSTGEKVKGGLKRLMAPDSGAVSSFTILDDMMVDLFD